MSPTNNGKHGYINLDKTPGNHRDRFYGCWNLIRGIADTVKNWFFQLVEFCRQIFATVKNWVESKFLEPTGICRRKLVSDLYYCQKDLADNGFEIFWGKFLQDISLRKLKVGERAVGRIFLVLELPSKNRQNNVDVLSIDIEDIARKHLLEKEEDVILVHISFDGNNIENPPNLMTVDTLKRINMRLKRNFASYINIVYTGKHDFQECDINRNAANKLRKLSRKENRCIFRKIFLLFVYLYQWFNQ